MYRVEAVQFYIVGSCVYSHGISLPLKLLMYIHVEVDGFREKFAVWQQLSPSTLLCSLHIEYICNTSSKEGKKRLFATFS
jgi:hypothetical protein